MKSPFRSIRQSLLNEGKLLRYLGYAVGEIALIIIGILFALKINNMNEDRKAQAEFDAYVVQLKEDVGKAIENVNANIDLMEGFLKDAEFVLTFLELPENERQDIETFEAGLSILAGYSNPQVQVGLLGQLMDGNIDVIARDPVLTRRVLAMESGVEMWLGNLGNVTNRLDLSSQILTSLVGRGRRSKERDRPPKYELKTLESSEEFINTCYSIITDMGRFVGFTENILYELEDFLTVLEEYE